MLSKLALMVAAFLLLSPTAALAAPSTKAEGGDTATTTLHLSVPPLYLPVGVQLSSFAPEDPKDSVTNR